MVTYRNVLHPRKQQMCQNSATCMRTPLRHECTTNAFTGPMSNFAGLRVAPELHVAAAPTSSYQGAMTCVSTTPLSTARLAAFPSLTFSTPTTRSIPQRVAAQIKTAATASPRSSLRSTARLTTGKSASPTTWKSRSTACD